MILFSKKLYKIFLIIVLSFVFFIPDISFAANTKLEYSAWLPYWKKASSTVDILPHLSSFSEVSPFAYYVKPNGTLIDTLKIKSEPWPSFFYLAHAKNVKILPSILWTDTEAMHKVLRTYTLRVAHEKAIMKEVIENNFDGIDIDYERKKMETRKYFSYFLQEISTQLHNKKKILSCTIESRTPLDSRFKKVPTGVAYTNDYIEVNAYCDRVRIMAYDQMDADLFLNEGKGTSATYAPVADKEWVKKVINLATNVIQPNKIVIGVPTYGYEFRVTADGKWFDYEHLRALNHIDAIALAKKVGATPSRNSAGEMSFVYYSPNDIATTTATSTPLKKPIRLVWWSDASAIADKMILAQTLGLRGIAIFKIDGGEDPILWERLDRFWGGM